MLQNALSQREIWKTTSTFSSKTFSSDTFWDRDEHKILGLKGQSSRSRCNKIYWKKNAFQTEAYNTRYLASGSEFLVLVHFQ